MQNIFKESGITLTLDAAGLLRVDGLKALPTEKADEIRDQIRQRRDEIIRELVQNQFNDLWEKAWSLADYVDGDSAPYSDRVKRLPELLAMRAELSRMEQAGAKPPTKGLNP